MWPKAIAQLVELLPHVTRLVPMADSFFNQKRQNDDAQRRALDAMAEGLRGDLGQVTAAHSGLYRALNEQAETLARLRSEIADLKVAADRAAARESRLRGQMMGFGIMAGVAAVGSVATIVLVMHLIHQLR